jgi:EpsI family protein
MFRSRSLICLTVALLLQGAVFYAIASRSERAPAMRPLSTFQSALGDWLQVKDEPVSKEVQEVLRADDTLNRIYFRKSDGAQALLFVAYFRTQRTGASPHSPKNCIPGSGWEPSEPPSKIEIPVEGRAAPILVNLYVVERGEQHSVVLYWYEGHDRVIASEFAAKYWLIADSIRYRRSDTALVKVVIPPVTSVDLVRATAAAVDFVKASYPVLRAQLPL